MSSNTGSISPEDRENGNPFLSDVTPLIEWNDVEGELLPIQNCVCGEKFDYWTQAISIYTDQETIWTCPKCGVHLCFKLKTTIYRVQYV